MTWLQYNEALQELAPDSELVVGSGAQATWRVRKADLMPRHFIVRTSDGGVRIRPFSSDAVVAVNGRQVSSEGCELEDSDVVSAGSAQIDYWSATPGKRDRDADAPVPVGHLVDAGKRSAHVLRRVSTGSAEMSQIRSLSKIRRRRVSTPRSGARRVARRCA